jgi:gas vesicle protein
MSKESNIISGFVLGVMAGAAAGLLLAPNSGKRTRKKIKTKTKRVINDAKDSLSEVTADALLQVNEGIQDLSDKGQESMTRLKQKIAN